MPPDTRQAHSYSHIKPSLANRLEAAIPTFAGVQNLTYYEQGHILQVFFTPRANAQDRDLVDAEVSAAKRQPVRHPRPKNARAT